MAKPGPGRSLLAADLGFVVAFGPIVVALKPDPVDKGSRRLVLHGSQPKATLFPVAYEPCDLSLAVPASERSTATDIEYNHTVGAYSRVRVEIIVSPWTQQEPGCLILAIVASYRTSGRENFYAGAPEYGGGQPSTPGIQWGYAILYGFR